MVTGTCLLAVGEDVPIGLAAVGYGRYGLGNIWVHRYRMTSRPRHLLEVTIDVSLYGPKHVTSESSTPSKIGYGC